MPDKFSEVILILVGSTFIILVLVVLVITALFINQKRKFRHRLELTHLRNEYDRELLQTQLEIQSQTFETISRELHDNIGTLLSIAMVHLRSQRGNEVEALLNEAMDMLRDISKSLDPASITRLGWQQALLNELERFKRSKFFDIQSSVSGEPFILDASRQIILFRILQEAMNNIVKHADASSVTVNISYLGDELCVSICDNGKGMSAVSPPSDGAGLRNMKARAALLPAFFDLISENGTGTTVKIVYKQTV
jgi:two-component system, NarL family, sensor kinase